jgi:hypothetical protein
MSKNIDQIYTANPITTNASTDLIYIGQSPYGAGDDAAITYEDFSAQFGGVTAAQIQTAAFVSGVDSGTADVYVVTLDPSAPFTEGNGTVVSFSPLNANLTTSPTLSVNGNSALPILLPNNTDVSPGDIATGSVAVYVVYSNGVWLLLNPIVSYVSATQVQQSAFNIGIDSGLADAYNVALSPAVVSLTNGMVIEFLPLNPNATTSPTLAINGGTPYPISLINSNSPEPGDLNNNFNVYLLWNATTEVFILLNPLLSYVVPSDIQYSQYISGNDTGTADAYAINLSPAISSYYLGNIFIFLPAHTNLTTTPTLAINSLSPLTITSSTGPLSPGDLSTGVVAICVYNPGNANIILLNPATAGAATAIQVQESSFNIGLDTGTMDAYIVALSPVVNSYTNGLEVIFTPANTNLTTTPTLDAGAGAITIQKSSGPVLAGSLSPYMIAVCYYSQAANAFILTTPAL